VPHSSRLSREAERDQFPPKLSRVATSLVPTAVKIIVVGFEKADPPWFAPERCADSTKPTPDRLTFSTDQDGDPLEGDTCRLQSCGFRVARLSPCRGGLTAPFGDLLADALNGGMVAVNDGANGLTQVAQQVPSVSDLNRIRCPLTRAVRVSSGAIAGNDLNTRMMARPVSQAFSPAIRQKIDNRVAFQINKDCPVMLSAAPRPVIDSKNTRNRPRLGNAIGSPHQP
jgi:hypothetical protein